MNNSKLTLPFTVALILSGAHSASATVKKCAFDSCRDDAKIAMNVQALLDSHAGDGDLLRLAVVGEKSTSVHAVNTHVNCENC